MTHYDTLQVVPWADESVIRAAYRALMRVYHPDTNSDPEAQLRVREINAAFAVLGDSAKRAAYDAFPTLGNEALIHHTSSFAADQQPRWSTRTAGLLSIGMAVVVLSLMIAIWPQSGPRQPALGKAVENTRARGIAPLLKSLPPADTVVSGLKQSPAIRVLSEEPPLPTGRPRREVATGPLSGSAITIAHPGTAATVSSKPEGAIPVSKPVVAEIVLPKPASADQRPNATSRPPAVASCSRDSSKVGACADARQVQVERIAAIFFKQSMENADSQKQQLLLSARTRSTSSRNLCRSSECVKQSYLRQIKDTTEIMQGRIPAPQ